ncbi:hypothetical protein PoB_000905000 [Plakobranchus ocellatus]|uniref:Uncharacterized protein n=1 Tax=Plakobranchus ocellatus TaxID=259542 RepID=A0AAV3YIH2_9GAST|nr:hypothetical protein PoB_000905000 [Plakobranchus ocellatus]
MCRVHRVYFACRTDLASRGLDTHRLRSRFLRHSSAWPAGMTVLVRLEERNIGRARENWGWGWDVGIGATNARLRADATTSADILSADLDSECSATIAAVMEGRDLQLASIKRPYQWHYNHHSSLQFTHACVCVCARHYAQHCGTGTEVVTESSTKFRSAVNLNLKKKTCVGQDNEATSREASFLSWQS